MGHQGAKRQQGPAEAVALPTWNYLGGEMLTMDATQQDANIPSTATIVEIRARGGPVYFALNTELVVFENSPGYVPQDGGEILGPLTRLNTLAFVGALGSYAHLMYFREE